MIWFGRTVRSVKPLMAMSFIKNEVEQSTYNFEYADVDFLFKCFEQYEKEAQELLALGKPLPLPA